MSKPTDNTPDTSSTTIQAQPGTPPVTQPTADITPTAPVATGAPVAQPVVAQEDTDEFDKLTMLKARAALLGITHHPSIGAETLAERIREHLNKSGQAHDTLTSGITIKAAPVNEQPPAAQQQNIAELLEQLIAQTKVDPQLHISEAESRQAHIRHATRLVRVRIVCMNPYKRGWPGEIITVSNGVVGTLKKYIPFDSGTDGYHVPHMIYEALRDREMTMYVYSSEIHSSRRIQAPEFAITVLDPLTTDQLDELARRQAMANSVDN